MQIQKTNSERAKITEVEKSSSPKESMENLKATTKAVADELLTPNLVDNMPKEEEEKKIKIEPWRCNINNFNFK